MLGRLWCKFVHGVLLPTLCLDEYHSRLAQVQTETESMSTQLGELQVHLEELQGRMAQAEEFTTEGIDHGR